MSQSLLFETGRPSLPPRVTVFASGANEAREIRGFGLAGVSIGVSVSLIREEAIRELLSSSSRVFADSGAFSEVEFGPSGMSVVVPITNTEWKRRLAIYKRLAESLGPNVSVVAPDRVADQQTTLARLSSFRAEMVEIAALGAEVLIPVQNGDLPPAEFYRQAVETAQLDLVPAMPMKKAASSFADVLSFVQAVRPRRLHLLGMGFELQKARKLVSMLQAVAPEIDISMDSNRLRAVTGQGRTMTKLEGRMRAEEPEGVFGAVESEALDGAGRLIDYTDGIAEPSSWATTLQLEAIADVAGFSRLGRKSFMANPDTFLQAPAGEDADIAWIELPHISHALDLAWQSHVSAQQQRSIRTAAVRRTFEESRIARSTVA
jgi:hypothetical protein